MGTSYTAEEILEKGISFSSSKTSSRRKSTLGWDRIFYETAAGCLEAASAEAEGGTQDGIRLIVLCRVLCGSAQVTDSSKIQPWHSLDEKAVKQHDSFVAMTSCTDG